MSDRPTPRTDSAIMEIPSKFGSICVVRVELALDLERELGEALQERDEAREEIEALRHEYHGAKAMAGGFKDKIKSLTEERDEAREVLREIAEASSFDNIGNWARNKARKEIDQYREKSDLPPISWDV